LYFNKYYINYKLIEKSLIECLTDNNKKELLLNFLKKVIKIDHVKNNKVLINTPNLREINFDPTYNSEIENIPECVINIKLCGEFNKQLNNLPKGLKTLYLQGIYDHSVENLPEGLESLHLSIDYSNRDINIPSSVKKLITSTKLKEIPETITHLIIRRSILFRYTQSYWSNFSILHNNLIYFECSFIRDIPDSLSECLKVLKLKSAILTSSDILPPNLEHLSIMYTKCDLSNLPDSLKKLKIKTIEDVDVKNLPTKLKNLHITNPFVTNISECSFDNFDNLCKNIQKNLITLSLGSYKKSKLQVGLVRSLSTQGIEHFEMVIDNFLGYNIPKNVVNLKLGYEYNNPIKKLPESIKTLTLCTKYEHNLDHLNVRVIKV
jgi:ACT domain-containing protein